MFTPVNGPATRASAVTTSDTADIAVTRGLYVGVAGDVKVDFVDAGTAVVLKALAAGVVHPLRVKRVYATGTAATDIVALY